MANATRVETIITCYPKEAIPFRKNNGFIIADVLGDSMNFSAGDSAGAGYQGQNSMPSIPWLGANTPTASSQSNVEFARFYKDGTVSFGNTVNDSGEMSILAGYIIEARHAYLDCKVQGESPSPPDAGNFDLTWKSEQGKHKSVIPPVAPKHNCFINSGSDVTAKARTVGTIPANRAVSFECYFSTLNSAGPQSAIRIAIGDKYSLVGRHGMSWMVDKKANGEWSQWRRLDKAGACNMHGKDYRLSFRRIAGYLVVSIGAAAFWLLEDGQGAPGQTQPRSVPEISWPEAPVVVNAYNVRARIGVALIKYSTATDSAFTGSFTRSFERATRVDGEMLTTGSCTGWRGAAPKPSITPIVTPGNVQYTCLMTGSAQGIDTPFVNKVMVRSRPIWGTTEVAGINVESCRRGDLGIDKAMPPITAGTEVSFTLDRDLLLFIFNNWKDYVKQFNPIEVRTRQHYDDGSTDGWIVQFYGYIYKLTYTTNGFGNRLLSVTTRDQTMRLQEENAIIDQHYPPLDFAFTEKLEGGGDAVIYTSDCVKEIVATALGPEAAETLNGNGDGNRFINEPIPLIDANSGGGFLALREIATGQAVTTNGFFFPPKLLEDAMSWINDFSKIEGCLFFYGWVSDDASGRQVLIYGRRKTITANRPTYVLPDMKYTANDINRLILAMENEKKPERCINRYLTAGKAEDGALGSLMISRYLGDARLPAGHPNSAENSWVRTKVIRSEMSLFAQQELANGLVAGIPTGELDFPKLTVRFMGYLQWGDKVTPKMEGTLPNIPDNTIGLNGETFRVAKLGHVIPEGGNDAKTVIWVESFTGFGY